MDGSSAQEWRRRGGSGRGAAMHGAAILPRLLPGLLTGLLMLGGCDHRDPTDIPAGWWHDLEGGRIAQDRPPPPGVNDPYPLVGTVPGAPPTLPNPQQRIALTATLTTQRNATLRRDADTPLPPPGTQVGSAPPPGAPAATGVPPASQAAPTVPAAAPTTASTAASTDASAAGERRSSVQFDAATPQPAPTSRPSPTPPPAPEPHPVPPARSVPAAQVAQDAPLLSMPALLAAPPPEPTNAPIPQFAPAPPPIPWLHGITITQHATPKAPDIPPLVEPGTAVAFDYEADTLQDGEVGQMRSIAGRWRRGTILVHGYGDALSAQPQAQIAALDLAWRRAKVVARLLVADGVPQGAVTMSADAFGHDVRVVESP